MVMFMVRAALLVALVFAPAVASADTLILKDGQTFEGVVTERGEQVEVQLEFGTVGFDRSDVKSIERAPTALHELDERTAALRPNDLAGTLSLARWATQNGLEHGARVLYERALVIAPNDATAHRALGHRQHEGRWLDEAEYLRATGHVRYGGEWMTKDEARAREEASDARRAARAAAEVARANAAETARLERQQAALEARVDDLEDDPNLRFYGWGWNGYGWLPGQVGVRRPVAPRPYRGIRGRGPSGTISSPRTKFAPNVPGRRITPAPTKG